jgi:tyrosyl-tRNA synthetase
VTAATHPLDLLKARGFVANVSDEDGLHRAFSAGPVSFYCGFDPTASSLHVGNLLGLMLLANLQRAGHRPIGVVGGGTGLIGDPSGRVTAGQRPLLSREQIEHNLQGIRRQVGRYLDLADDRALVVNNADWLEPLRWLDFLRDIGRHFTLNQLMQHETYRERFEQDSLSFIELNYALVQAYDFLHLYRTYGCILQTGGNDQWFNILAGVQLIQRADGGQAYALTTPLLTTSSGQKMGKSESGAIWLDPSLTPPYDYYQFWRNTEDPDVGRFLRLYTFLPLDEIAELEKLEGAAINQAKDLLAFEATRITHGDEEATRARAAARARFAGEGEDQGPAYPITAPLTLLDLLVATNLASSKGEARRLIDQGGIRLDDSVQTDPKRLVAPDDAPALLIRGKRRARLIRE